MSPAPAPAKERVTFPSVRWFEALGALMNEQHDHFAKFGDIDCTMQVTILDGAAGGVWRVQVEFEQLSVVRVAEVDEGEEDLADFILETDVDTWREMIESIVAGKGQPGLDHTLNRLSMPGTPIRLWSGDPIRRDTYYRFNQSLQHYVNNAWMLDTYWADT